MLPIIKSLKFASCQKSEATATRVLLKLHSIQGRAYRTGRTILLHGNWRALAGYIQAIMNYNNECETTTSP